ncbi:EAL domain-containing protein [Paucibacter sp. PLA-PC-4]|uniref:two-component system response regulator n=1 Tax=Paucibacter sp. PLA-PC-4 TaxID=2993655 RepID=UPI002248E60F|nr:EAL domain-containing protein [Paucibacter sp. PLA-PC-4]MCX2860493.1 EAL domain-containing protein [Paucibacter sp. PLA-PC-4]
MFDAIERPLRVQIVEDERIVALDLRSGLEQLGFEVVGIAANEPEAVRLATSTVPDLVLMDIHLDRGSDGIDAARQIRELLAVPVIFLTAYGEPETLKRAALAAPYGYLLKPFELRELNATVCMAMARRREEIKTEKAERRLLLALESARLSVLELESAGGGALRWSGHGLGSELGPLGQAMSIAELRQHLDPTAGQALDELLQQGRPMDMVCRWQAGSGASRWMEIHARRFEADQLVMGMLRDVTERIEGETRLRQALVVFDATDEAILFLDADCLVLSCNPAFSAMTGWAEAEVQGRAPESFLYARRHGDHMDWPARTQRQGEVTCMRRDGSTFPALEHLCAVLDAQGQASHHVLSFSDISEIRDTQFKLQHLALHDPLTGLGNRLHLQEALQAHIVSGGAPLGLIFIDLDGFKTINDTLGHDCGDELLKALAARLKSLLRREDVAIRLGGDEFVVLMSHASRAVDALALAAKLLAAIAKPVSLQSQVVCVTASAGVALWPEHVCSPHALLKAADAAMYEAKSRGRNRAALYEHSQAEEANEQLRIEQGLRQALERCELLLHWQPVVEMRSGRILGAEALLRWQHPQLGAVAPNRFIPVAETTGLIVPIGAWVLDQACAQAAVWARLWPELRVAVNVSVRQFEQDDVPALVRDALQRHRLDPGCLEIEVTESLFGNTLALRHMLVELRALGVHIALDDFGTGYSSLGQLKTLPLDRLKIDRCFVADLTPDSDSHAIVQTIVTLAHSLKLALTAEGVENEVQRQILLGLGAGDAQGWLFHRAMPADQFAALLRSPAR